LIWASVIAGIITLIRCAQVDLSGSHWWHDRSYIPNVWAGFTGFLIGAPVGLVILATFQTEREQSDILARVNSLSEAAWKNFVKAFQDFCTVGRMEATTIAAMKTKSEHDETYKALLEFISFIRIGRPRSVKDENDDRTISDFYPSNTRSPRGGISGPPRQPPTLPAIGTPQDREAGRRSMRGRQAGPSFPSIQPWGLPRLGRRHYIIASLRRAQRSSPTGAVQTVMTGKKSLMLDRQRYAPSTGAVEPTARIGP
jgi:hypothetical protein